MPRLKVDKYYSEGKVACYPKFRRINCRRRRIELQVPRNNLNSVRFSVCVNGYWLILNDDLVSTASLFQKGKCLISNFHFTGRDKLTLYSIALVRSAYIGLNKLELLFTSSTCGKGNGWKALMLMLVVVYILWTSYLSEDYIHRT